MTERTADKSGYTIQPYHMNGLNWRLVPDDPQPDNIVVVTGFMPEWWTREYGLQFGEDFHLNSEVHRATLARMEDELRRRFGDLPNFFCGDDYAQSIPMERRMGDALIPALFGATVSFDDASGHPFAHGMELTPEQVERLEPPPLIDHPVVQTLLLASGADDERVAGNLGYEGVINIAYKLRGQNLFLDMVDAPARVQRLCEVVWKTITGMVDLVRTWSDSTGTRPSHFVNCNCLVNMLSPSTYRGQMFDFDRRFRRHFDLFGIHTCNWNVDPYLDVLAEIPDLAYLDMGAESNIERVHRLFPDLCPSVFVHPVRFSHMSESAIRHEITELGRRIGRGYILLSDLEPGTTDGQIRAAYEAAARL